MAAFSWSDTVQAAFSSCLPCFARKPPSLDSDADSLNNNSSQPFRIRQARADELEGLLADNSDNDTNAETLSLHSNPGDRRKRKNHKKPSKRITIFGWDLFGRSPIHLPEQEGTDDPLHRRRGFATSTISSSTFDSDAAPLDIDALTPAQVEAAAAAADLRAKEERRQQRKAKKELKRVAQALAVQSGEGDFEGFQGSGEGYPRQPHLLASPSVTSGSGSAEAEHFGPFVGAGEREDDYGDADLDAALYTRKTSPPLNGSDSRSRTSASRSDQYSRHFISQDPPSYPGLPSEPRRKSKSRKSKSSKKSQSSTTSTSQSPSLPSPVDTSFPSPVVAPPGELSTPAVNTPSSERFANDIYGFPSAGFSRGGAGMMPSTGFGRGKGRDLAMGAFLATRGDD